MGTEKLRGIVLREQAKGESNKQIVLLAQGVGRVLLSARGARRAKSKLLAATQLFCYADFVVYEGRGFYSVTQAELKNSFYGLRLDMDKFSEGMYLAELTETNRHMNLTAITEPAEAWEKHFLDCAILLQKVQLPLGAACIDVGTGAGFPGMVLALLRPDLQVTLLDSLQKRIGFLEQTAAKLGLANVRCIHARAEDGAKLPELREQFDMATARAVAAMPVLTEYCLPFVKQGGVFAAMKGPSETAEQAETAAKLLGGEIVGEESYTLPTAGERKLIRIRKTAPTPQKYPRRSDKIKKQPLG